jgi:hypothetical protein
MLKCVVSVQHIFTHDSKYKTVVVFCNEAQHIVVGAECGEHGRAFMVRTCASDLIKA